MIPSTLVSLLALALVGQSMAAPLIKPFPMRVCIHAARLARTVVDLSGYQRMESRKLELAERDLVPGGMIKLYERQFSDSSPAMAP